MNDCTRFEEEGLIALEQGLPLGEHFTTCRVCVEEHRKYTALKEMLKNSNGQISPPSDWEQTVWNRIGAASTENNKSGHKQWYGALAAGIATITIASMLFLQGPDPTSSKSLIQQIVPSDRTYRGENAKIGDELIIVGNKDHFKYMQIRVYRNGRPYFACDQNNMCAYDEDSNIYTAKIKLTAIGEYQSLLIRSDQPVNITSKDLDLDVLDARELGADVILAESVTVQ